MSCPAEIAGWNASRIGLEVTRDEILLGMVYSGVLNRSMCDALAAESSDRSGLFNFSWTSETEMAFLTPCEQDLTITNYPKKGNSYRQVVVPTSGAGRLCQVTAGWLCQVVAT